MQEIFITVHRKFTQIIPRTKSLYWAHFPKTTNAVSTLIKQRMNTAVWTVQRNNAFIHRQCEFSKTACQVHPLTSLNRARKPAVTAAQHGHLVDLQLQAVSEYHKKKIYEIQFTLIKCTIQWFLVQSQSCATVITSVSFRKYLSPASCSIVLLFPSPHPAPGNHLSAFCLNGFTGSGYFTLVEVVFWGPF